MTRKHNLVVKAKDLLGRLNGFTVPVIGAGISWTLPPDERDTARELLVFLEDRRALYQPYASEVGDYVIRSILEIRQRLVSDLQRIDGASPLAACLRPMLATCRDFLNKTQTPRADRYWMTPELIIHLGELRALLGLQIARIAQTYNLDVKGELTAILPPEVEAE